MEQGTKRRGRKSGLPKLIERYYGDLAELAHQNVMYEMGTRPAFHALLAGAGREHHWTLIAEHEKKVNGKTIRPDGTFKDGMNLVRGYWEAKDTGEGLPSLAKGTAMNRTAFFAVLAVTILAGVACGQATQPSLMERWAKALDTKKTVATQPATQPSTKIEALMSTRGVLIVRDFFDVPGFFGAGAEHVDLDAVVVYVPGLEEKRLRGLRIVITQAGRAARSDKAFIDYEDLPDLSAAMAHMKNISGRLRAETREYTEIEYETNGGFAVGFRQENRKQVFYITTGKEYGLSCTLDSASDFDTLKGKIDQAIGMLAKK